MEKPTRSQPCSLRSAAAAELSTPPLIATATLAGMEIPETGLDHPGSAMLYSNGRPRKGRNG
jgi:hypothetical protein